MRSKAVIFIITALTIITGTSVAMASQLGDGTTVTTEPTIYPVTKPTTVDPVLEEFPTFTRGDSTTTTTSPVVITTTTTIPEPPKPPVFVASVDNDSRWDQLAMCEAGGDWSKNTGNGFGGGLQFMHQPSYSTWTSFGGAEFAPNPWDATREQQIAVAERVLAKSGWKAWPGCSIKFGWI